MRVRVGRGPCLTAYSNQFVNVSVTMMAYNHD